MINIAEKLKDCPKGTKLYSPLLGEVTLYKLQEVINKGSYTILVKTLKDSIFSFNSFGQHCDYSDSECMLFPSKENRNWNTFNLFKDGDVLTYMHWGEPTTFIYNAKGCYTTTYYAAWSEYCKRLFINTTKELNVLYGNPSDLRYATDEEKQKLFKIIKNNGYNWNSETKTLEKLITPNFKVGDKIINKKDKRGWVKIATITDNCYIDEYRAFNIPLEKQDEWELYVDKFDITTLKHYDKVLARHNNYGIWKPQLFSYLDANYEDHCYKFVLIGQCSVSQCIPYEGNEHLIGTTDECAEYYKTWK